jgi:hypothetical protein
LTTPCVLRSQAGPVDYAELIAGKRGIVETMRREQYVDLAAMAAANAPPPEPTIARS